LIVHPLGLIAPTLPVEVSNFFHFLILFTSRSTKKKEKVKVKKIEKNISRHSNGTLYFVARRLGKLHVRSLHTDDLGKARKIVRENGIKGLTSSEDSCTAREPVPEAPLRGKQVPLLEEIEKKAGAAEGLSLEAVLKLHAARLVLISPSAREMADRGAKVCLMFGESLQAFSPIAIWNAYRKTGITRLGRELTSSANHLLWFLRKFVPWAVREGYLPLRCEQELRELRKVKVNPRRIRIPSADLVKDFLAMIAAEDSEGAVFLRFLAVTGLRRSAAIGLLWQDIDLDAGTMLVRQKGGREEVIPLTPEARELLEARRARPRPFGYGIKEIEVLERRMKRIGKGLDIDLVTFHSFRHFFASKCLLAGLTVPEVAKLLGHNDGGALVLKTYGHLCGAHLREAVNGLRLAS